MKKLYSAILISLLTISFFQNGYSFNTNEITPKACSVESLNFIENKGQIKQTDDQAASYVSYLLNKGNVNIFLLREGGIVYQFNKIYSTENNDQNVKSINKEEMLSEKMSSIPNKEAVRLETFRMDMQLVGANPNAEIVAEDISQDYINDYSCSILFIHHYKKISYKNVYPGIDWVIYTKDNGLKYDFIVHPGANPQQIKMIFTHHEELYIDDNGNLIHGNRMGKFIEKKPVSYQNTTEIKSEFILIENNLLGFKIGNYDPNQVLTIDPDRLWATYYGGTARDEGLHVVTDKNGNVYMSGFTESNANIAEGGHRNTRYASDRAFWVKFNIHGVRQWATYYGGGVDGSGIGLTCTTDKDGNVYLCGNASATSGISSGGHQNSSGGSGDAFLVKFNSNGIRLWGTFYGGQFGDVGHSCATDDSGNVYLTGLTYSPNNIASGGYKSTNGGDGDAFLVKFNSNGVRQWGTYYGTAGHEVSFSCCVDKNGDVYMTGRTSSTNGIATTGAHQTSMNGLSDCFLVKFNSSGARLWGTYYGGNDFDIAYSCASDDSGNIYISGFTSSSGSIGFKGHRNSYAGNTDGFLAKFDSDGERLWGTYYGGTAYDRARGCSTDDSGNVYLAGITMSSNFISSNGFQNNYGGGYDAFLAKFNFNGVRQWGTYYGGDKFEGGYQCATDNKGNVYLTGVTESDSTIFFEGHQSQRNGNKEAFLVKFSGIPAFPNIEIKGNNFTIANGSQNTSVINNTNFGTTFINISKSFKIVNKGEKKLLLTGMPRISITGLNSSDFTLVINPDSIVLPYDSTYFTISFIPNTFGLRTAIVEISNNDTSQNPFTFTIKAEAIPVPKPIIAVKGNGLEILNGSTNSDSVNHTDFGKTDKVISKSFFIVNKGNAILNLTGSPSISISGINSSDFSVSKNPSLTVAPSDSTNFNISFSPSVLGIKSATVTIINNDIEKTPFTFNIQAEATDKQNNINNISYTSKINIVPNPSNGKVVIEFENNTGASNIEIMDYCGKIVYKVNSDDNKLEIDLSYLPKGLYIIRIIQQEGMTSNHKVIIE